MPGRNNSRPRGNKEEEKRKENKVVRAVGGNMCSDNIDIQQKMKCNLVKVRSSHTHTQKKKKRQRNKNNTHTKKTNIDRLINPLIKNIKKE